MKLFALIALTMFALLLVQPASAECLYFKNKDGFPLGIIPSPKNITATFSKPAQLNATFLLYIEAEAGTSTSIECRVTLENVNKSIALGIELSNYSLETGAAHIERPITVFMTPLQTVNFPKVIETQIKITDADNSKNYAVFPIYAKFDFAPTKPSPSIKPSPSDNAGGVPSFVPVNTVKPTPVNNSGISSIVKLVEDNTSKYMIAVVAFIFLGALLWLGFNSLQRD